MNSSVFTSLGLALLACAGKPPLPATPEALVDRCVHFEFRPAPPIIEDWPLPETLKFVGPLRPVLDGDSLALAAGGFDLNIAVPEGPHEAEWWISGNQLVLDFHTGWERRRLIFKPATPLVKGTWRHSYEFDHLEGKVKGTLVPCPDKPASS